MKNPERSRAIIAGICSLILTVGLARFAYTPLLPIMRNEAGLSYLAGGWLATYNYIGYITGAFLAASISNLNWKYQIYRVGLIIAVISTSAMGMTQNVVLWGILRFISGFSSIAGLLLASGLILNWLIRNGHKPWLGFHFAGLGLGIMVSGLAVAMMVGQFNWDEQWYVLGLLGILFFIPAWLWIPAPADAQTQELLKSSYVPTDRWMTLLIATYFCAGFGYVISATFIVSILEKLPLFEGRGGWVWIMVGIAATPSSFIWDHVAHRMGQIPAMMLAYALQIIAIILPVVTVNATINLIGAVIYGGTFVGIVSLALTLVGRHFPDNPAKAMARLTLSYGVAQIIAPAIAGHIADVTGTYKGSLIVATIMMIIGMMLLVMLRREEGRS